jgi:hypothetical protein
MSHTTGMPTFVEVNVPTVQMGLSLLLIVPVVHKLNKL